MAVQPGELLVASNGKYYRVVDCADGVVSLMRIDGYTLFSCKANFLTSTFRPVTSSVVV